MSNNCPQSTKDYNRNKLKKYLLAKNKRRKEAVLYCEFCSDNRKESTTDGFNTKIVSHTIYVAGFFMHFHVSF